MQKEIRSKKGINAANDTANKRMYFNVPYANKDVAKKYGAWWDPDKKLWYAPSIVSADNKAHLINKFSRAKNI